MVRLASRACFVRADAAARRAERIVEVRRSEADIMKRFSVSLPTRLISGAVGRDVGLFFHKKLKIGRRRGALGFGASLSMSAFRSNDWSVLKLPKSANSSFELQNL